MEKEKPIATYGHIKLYNDCVTYETKTFRGEQKRTIPLNKIDSFYLGQQKNILLIILGTLFLTVSIPVIIGLMSTYLQIGHLASFFYIFVGVGIIGFILLYIANNYPEENITIKSPTATISTKFKDGKKFIKKLENKLFKT